MHTVWPHLPHAHGVSLAGRIYPERLGRNYPVRQRHRMKQLSLYEVVARPPVDITSVANKQEIINKHYWPLHYMMPVSFTHANIYLSKTLIVIKCVLSTFKHYNKRINTHTHACLLHSRPHLHTPEARDQESSVSNRFVGGLYSPVAAIPPASPKQPVSGSTDLIKTVYTADYGDQQVEKFYNKNRKQHNHHDHIVDDSVLG